MTTASAEYGNLLNGGAGGNGGARIGAACGRHAARKRKRGRCEVGQREGQLRRSERTIPPSPTSWASRVHRAPGRRVAWRPQPRAQGAARCQKVSLPRERL